MSIKSHLMDDTAVIVFLRVPQKGRVKTRLAEAFDEDFVLLLYKSFVKDLLEKIEPASKTVLYYWPDDMEDELASFVGNGYECHPQTGEGLGERMANALEAVFQAGSGKAVLIGTDIPEINLDILCRASDLLDTKDAVVGPADDGGYYLIGFERSGYSGGVFEGIEWSGPDVFEQTTRYMERNNISYGVVSLLEDIDTPDDLKKLALRVKNTACVGPRTHALLEKICLLEKI